MKKALRFKLLIILLGIATPLAAVPEAQEVSTFGGVTEGSQNVLTAGIGWDEFLLVQYDFAGAQNFAFGLRGEIDFFEDRDGNSESDLDLIVSLPLRIGIVPGDVFSMAIQLRPGLGIFTYYGTTISLILDPTLQMAVRIPSSPAFLSIIFGVGLPMTIDLVEENAPNNNRFTMNLQIPLGVEFALLSNLNLFAIGFLDAELIDGDGFDDGASGGFKVGLQWKIG